MSVVRSIYRPVPPEPWGYRLARVRETVAHLTLEQATSLAGRFILTTKSAISRLEQLDDVPTGPRSASKRARAIVLCKVYEVDPAEFGLSDDDLPPGIHIPPRTPGPDGRASLTGWYDTAAA